MSKEIKFEIEECIGVISQDDKITTELNLVKWNGDVPKYDLRRWKNDGDEKKPYKGLVMRKEELAGLKEILNGLEA